MSGYSNTPLIKKLGIKSGMKVVFVNPPNSFEEMVNLSTKEVSFDHSVRPDSEYIHFFTTSLEELKDALPDLKNRLSPTGMLWVSWPKGSSGVSTNISENKVREAGLKNGLVDVKICSIDETWSGLKFVFRLKDR